MFYTQLADQILPNYPRGYDQAVYAASTYKLIDQFRGEGWTAFLHQVANPSPTGLSFIIQGALLSLVGGPNRGAFVSLKSVLLHRPSGMPSRRCEVKNE